MYLSLYTLDLKEARALRLTDSYSLHRVVYDLFEDARGGDTQENSGILFADKGGDARARRLHILSDRPPREPRAGRVETREIPAAWFEAQTYRFEIVVNPVRRQSSSGRIMPVRSREAVDAWFREKAPGWGFDVINCDVRSLEVDRFSAKEGRPVTLARATVTGVLRVSDRQRFIHCACHGIGRGRAFGCGLLQLVPLTCEA